MGKIEPELIEVVRAKAAYWQSEITDVAIKKEITAIINDLDNSDVKKQEAAVDAFYQDIDFGTGGLRGLMGIGSNRINSYTLAKATRGLIGFCKENFSKEYVAQSLSFAIAYDTRNNSKLYAEQVATLLAENGITVYFFATATPTPVLSYTVRKYGCQIGIMITASHNPKEYNGYKVYFGDGGQIVPPHDKNIIAKVNQVKEIDYEPLTINEVQDESVKARIKYVDEAVMTAYQNEAKTFIKRLLPAYENKIALDLPVVITALHGTGGSYILPGLKDLGFTAVSKVAAQNEPDSNFSTVVYPNPEEHEALTLGIKQMQAERAVLLIGTDPDADRIGVAILDNQGKPKVLNGNQIGILLADFVLTLYHHAGVTHRNPYLVRTIVTTSFIDEIAKTYGVEIMAVLTGFKYIGELMSKFENKRDYVFGLEESHGYLANTNVRDKDAVSSAYLMVLMAAYYHAKKTSVYERLVDLYLQHGYGLEQLVSLTKTGPNGQREITELMNHYEQTYGNSGTTGKPINIISEELLYFRDYDKQMELNLTTGEKKSLALPRSKVIQLETKAKTVITVRPSGTEPKIKYYFSVRPCSGANPSEHYKNMGKSDKYSRLDAQHALAIKKITALEALFVKK